MGFVFGSRRVLQDSSAILCPDFTEYELLKNKYPNQRVEYFPNGVDIEKFGKKPHSLKRVFQIKEESFLMTIVGRIDPQKNQSFILELMPRLIASIPNIHLLIVGPV
ncbi:hypothetical protein MJH12_15635, partial [bacterium]|nr:hypothetical protein [bacterium]